MGGPNVAKALEMPVQGYSMTDFVELDQAFARIWGTFKSFEPDIDDEDLAERIWQMVTAVAVMDGIVNSESIVVTVMQCFGM